MLASLLTFSQTAGYPLLFVLIMAESGACQCREKPR
jgi:hypothetical protein